MSQPMSVPPKYNPRDLEEYLRLTQLICGEVSELPVSQEFADWYVSWIKQVAKNLNIPTTKNRIEPKYLHVKLVVK